ncbi:ABC transporter permease [Paenibacillus flagellatus]|uniref:Polysaccharide ABC transporter ATP-binding protein n=1 Tax=Paenibacillus flagellatus TaxID=2211139 RepID=A0A2V5K070_9BACL|nr:sugar ABC transporter permease [Paenibacillus flagellatus]PYI51952.1 polysaccharide ABC transporter ATP-binding protein [Paenibacillus flagellatus]
MRSSPSRKLFADLARDKYLYLLALPGIVYFLVFKYLPVGGLVIAFQEYSPYFGIWGSEWVGFEHFQRFFSNDDFVLLMRNTLMISLMNLVFFFPLPIVLSLMLNELRGLVFKRFVQTVVYIPHFLSWVLISGLTYLMLSQSEGLVNKLLAEFGHDRIGFLTDPDLFWGLLTAQVMWKEAGWGTIIFLAAIAGVDPQLYEAAVVDGAGRFRKMWHITLPAIRNVIVILFILRLGSVMDVGFEQVYLMMNGAVSDVAEVFDTYVFRNGVKQGEFSYSTAIGLFKSVVGIVLVVAANKLAKKFGEEGVY